MMNTQTPENARTLYDAAKEAHALLPGVGELLGPGKKRHTPFDLYGLFGLIDPKDEKDLRAVVPLQTAHGAVVVAGWDLPAHEGQRAERSIVVAYRKMGELPEGYAVNCSHGDIPAGGWHPDASVRRYQMAVYADAENDETLQATANGGVLRIAWRGERHDVDLEELIER